MSFQTELTALLDWCSGSRVAAIPYGGGSSVVGGVEARLAGDWRGALSIDLGRLDRVLDEAPIPDGDKVKIYQTNAERVFRLTAG